MKEVSPYIPSNYNSITYNKQRILSKIKSFENLSKKYDIKEREKEKEKAEILFDESKNPMYNINQNFMKIKIKSSNLNRINNNNAYKSINIYNELNYNSELNNSINNANNSNNNANNKNTYKLPVINSYLNNTSNLKYQNKNNKHLNRSSILESNKEHRNKIINSFLSSHDSKYIKMPLSKGYLNKIKSNDNNDGNNKSILIDDSITSENSSSVFKRYSQINNIKKSSIINNKLTKDNKNSIFTRDEFNLNELKEYCIHNNNKSILRKNINTNNTRTIQFIEENKENVEKESNIEIGNNINNNNSKNNTSTKIHLNDLASIHNRIQNTQSSSNIKSIRTTSRKSIRKKTSTFESNSLINTNILNKNNHSYRIFTSDYTSSAITNSIDNYKCTTFVKTDLMCIENYSIFGVINGIGELANLICKNIKFNIIDYFNDHRNFHLNLTEKINLSNFSNAENFSNFLDTLQNKPLEQCFSYCENKIKKAKLDHTCNGASVSLLLILNRKIICISVGDCRTILFKKNGEYIIANNLHNATNKEEFSRIQKHGGIFSSDSDEGISIHSKNSNKPGINVTRCIGNSSGNKIGINNIPEIKEMPIEEYDYAIIANNCFWELMPIPETNRIISYELDKIDIFWEMQAKEIAKVLIDTAISLKSRVSA